MVCNSCIDIAAQFLKNFVHDQKWIDDQLVSLSVVEISMCDGEMWTDSILQYQELFALCQSTPGPGSTKMLYGIAWVRGGFLSALLVFLMWR